MTRTADEQYRRSSRREAISVADEESPFLQELVVRQLLAPAGVPVVEHAPEPAHGGRVEEPAGIQAVERLLVEPIRGRIAQKPLDLVGGAALIAPAAADERSADVAVQIDRLLAAGRLRNVEDQQRPTVDLDHVLPNGERAVDLPSGSERAQELSLHPVHFQDTDDLEDAVVVADRACGATAPG